MENKHSYLKTILKLAVPVMIAMLAQALVNQADSIMVGYLDKEVATGGQAGIGVSLKFLWIIGGFLSALSVGTVALVARRNGENDNNGVASTMINSITIALFSSLAATVFAIIFTDELIRLISSNQEVLRYGIPYLQIRFLGIVSMVLTAVYKGYFDSLKQTYIHMIASILMNIVNIGLNYLLIYGKFGFPKLEVNGAAIASIISTYVGLAIMIGFSFKGEFYQKFKLYKIKNINWSVSKNIIKLSLPAGTATIVLVLGFLLFDKIIATLDGTTGMPYNFTVNQLIMSVFIVLAMVGISFGNVTASLVGNSIGEKNFEAASKYGWTSARIGGIIMGIIGITMVIWPEFFIKLYNSDPELIKTGANSFRVMGAVTPLVAIGMILSQAHFGAGNTRFVMFVEVSLHFGFLVPLSYLVVVFLKFGLISAWIVAASYMILLSVIMMYTFYRGKWKQIKI